MKKFLSLVLLASFPVLMAVHCGPGDEQNHIHQLDDKKTTDPDPVVNAPAPRKLARNQFKVRNSSGGTLTGLYGTRSTQPAKPMIFWVYNFEDPLRWITVADFTLNPGDSILVTLDTLRASQGLVAMDVALHGKDQMRPVPYGFILNYDGLNAEVYLNR